MKRNIPLLLIHGGMTFKDDRTYVSYLKRRPISLEKSRRWRDAYLEKSIGPRFEVIRPRMPLSENANYRDWKIWFERHLAIIQGRPVLVGHSLGGIFLAKYLSENKLKYKAHGVYLVAPPFDSRDLGEGESLVGGFELKQNLSLLAKNTDYLHLFFSTDDPIISARHARKYQNLLPKESITVLKNRGHFSTPTFPEIVKLIKSEALGKK